MTLLLNTLKQVQAAEAAAELLVLVGVLVNQVVLDVVVVMLLVGVLELEVVLDVLELQVLMGVVVLLEMMEVQVQLVKQAMLEVIMQTLYNQHQEIQLLDV